MIAVGTLVDRLSGVGAVGGGLVLAGLLVWLLGLLIVLRDSKPAERPAIIRAYATCRPLAFAQVRGVKPDTADRELGPTEGEPGKASSTETSSGPSPAASLSPKLTPGESDAQILA
jgi:hypothetical protein